MPANGQSDDEAVFASLRKKFLSNTTPVLGASRAEELLTELEKIRQADSLREIMKLTVV